MPDGRCPCLQRYVAPPAAQGLQESGFAAVGLQESGFAALPGARVGRESGVSAGPPPGRPPAPPSPRPSRVDRGRRPPSGVGRGVRRERLRHDLVVHPRLAALLVREGVRVGPEVDDVDRGLLGRRRAAVDADVLPLDRVGRAPSPRAAPGRPAGPPGRRPPAPPRAPRGRSRSSSVSSVALPGHRELVVVERVGPVRRRVPGVQPVDVARAGPPGTGTSPAGPTCPGRVPRAVPRSRAEPSGPFLPYVRRRPSSAGRGPDRRLAYPATPVVLLRRVVDVGATTRGCARGPRRAAGRRCCAPPPGTSRSTG